jgi:hypothetical protein
MLQHTAADRLPAKSVDPVQAFRDSLRIVADCVRQFLGCLD